MGWTVLYIAFGIVALWLLGEVLLQYKARLRWRLLAFSGFMGVVLGVLLPSVLVIALGAIAFAVGQTYVTLSFRRGFSTGWAIGGSPGASRRRKDTGRPAAEREPSLEVSDLEYQPAAAPAEATAAYDPEPVYEPEPMPDDTGQYGVYNDYDTPAHDAPQQGRTQQPDADGWGSGAYDAYPGYQQPGGQDSYTGQGGYAAHDAYPGQDAYPGPDQDAYQPGHSGEHTYASQENYPGQDVYAQQYDYGNGQQQYTGYSDPYADQANGGQQYGSYDSFGGQQPYTDSYGGQQQYGAETPPGGVWVPQQREGEQAPPPQQPQQQGYDPDYNEQQYRY
ncbi:hypothetical protein [Streptomyces sp. NBC_00872]|uniref:hypothetical protein n=1 Tax=Streptomyces sp. NBC_00872 TaxID=2903686 RepID=UPI003862FB5E|nr:hypothetical protein OG214_28525 [Streptomyces sp. NBC_00872]